MYATMALFSDRLTEILDTPGFWEMFPSMFFTHDWQVMPSTLMQVLVMLLAPASPAGVLDGGPEEEMTFASKPMSSIASAASSGEMRVGSMTSLADFPSRDTEILITPGLEEREYRKKIQSLLITTFSSA